MKKLTLILCLLWIFQTTYAQNRTLGAYFSLDRTYRSLPDRYNYLDERDSRAPGLHAGVSYQFPLRKFLSLITGMEYGISGYDRQVYAAPPNMPGYTLKQRLSYIGVPTVIETKFAAKKLLLSLNAGVVHRVLLTASYRPSNIQQLPVYLPNPQSSPQKESFSIGELADLNYKMYNPELLAGISLALPFKSFIVGLAPEFRYAIFSTTKEASKYHTGNEHLYSFGTKISVHKLTK